ncbi:protein RALF-like 34 [Rhodamnia argentea]|uniref:Protein RALF-like 34 n=1 Tax=Rhodamnia argentea TaxID=178133 RepID=A0ABM3GVB6_9MYRT|nr:protein RALF-like 34 [Rhodamnia argentea]
MASSSVFNLALLTSFLLVPSLFTAPNLAQAQAGATDEAGLKLMTSDPAMEWPGAISMYDGFFGEGGGDGAGEEIEGEPGRRSLFWHTIMRYYISYGALSANRVPCPPRSGRSYYTHNCFKVSGPVHPYNRGCSRITFCRR